jgi:hypothetical protein
MRVPNVSPADDILNSGLKRAARVTPTKAWALYNSSGQLTHSLW